MTPKMFLSIKGHLNFCETKKSEFVSVIVTVRQVTHIDNICTTKLRPKVFRHPIFKDMQPLKAFT